jgi:N-acetylglucosaminyl-diphospho-decaprenol L-rhamnosyltransferase
MIRHRPVSEPGDVRDRSGRLEGPVRTADVTVVVVTYNSARHLAALGNALTSGSLAPTRMVVVDNASRDDTVACARAAGFEVFEQDVNCGFGAACNTALRASSTEFVLFCNPDVLPSPRALELLVTALTSNSTAAIAGAIEARRFSRITREVAGFLPSRLQHRIQGLNGSIQVDQRKEPVVVDYAVGAFIICRAAALSSVGGFDERFFLYCEEEDLSRRLGECGWQTVLVPAAVVAHEDSASCEGVDKTVTGPFRLHSRYLYYRKYHFRGYAEVARCLLAVCVLIDRMYRAIVHRRQVYGISTALAPFRHIDSIRRDYERYVSAQRER